MAIVSKKKAYDANFGEIAQQYGACRTFGRGKALVREFYLKCST